MTPTLLNNVIKFVADDELIFYFDADTKFYGSLDKISKSGYDTLTAEEKEFLFKQGKK